MWFFPFLLVFSALASFVPFPFLVIFRSFHFPSCCHLPFTFSLFSGRYNNKCFHICYFPEGIIIIVFIFVIVCLSRRIVLSSLFVFSSLSLFLSFLFLSFLFPLFLFAPFSSFLPSFLFPLFVFSIFSSFPIPSPFPLVSSFSLFLFPPLSNFLSFHPFHLFVCLSFYLLLFSSLLSFPPLHLFLFFPVRPAQYLERTTASTITEQMLVIFVMMVDVKPIEWCKIKMGSQVLKLNNLGPFFIAVDFFSSRNHASPLAILASWIGFFQTGVDLPPYFRNYLTFFPRKIPPKIHKIHPVLKFASILGTQTNKSCWPITF